MTGWRASLPWILVITVWGLVFLPVIGMAVLVGALVLGPRRSFWTLAPLWSRSVFWLCGAPALITGWEDLPEEIRQRRRPVIFMSNHESNLDPPVLIGSMPIPAVFLAKKEVRLMGPVGWAAIMAGTIFIDRSNSERAVASLHQAAREIRGGKSVIIFPEGTRSRSGSLGTLKKGGFVMAQEAGVLIVPVATVGGHRMLPPGTVLLRPGRYCVAFGAPVDPQDYPTRETLIADVRQRIQALHEEAQQAVA